MSDDSSLREQFEDGLWVGDWFIEPMRNRVWLQDQEVQLEPKVMEVLLCMAKRAGKTVTKSQFKEKVWTETVVTDDVLSRCISELRKTFDDDPQDPSYIETIRKTGYRLIAPVRAPDATDRSPPVGEETASSSQDALPLTSRQHLPQTLSENTETALSFVSKGWNEAVGDLPRTQRFVLGSAIVLLLVLALALWATSGPSPGRSAPFTAKPFTSFAGEEFDPSLTTLGHQVAFAWRQPDSLHQNIFLSQRGAEQPLRLSPDSTVDRSPTWSPDGRFVAYVQQSGPTHRVSIVPSIGGRPTQALTLPRRKIQSIAWMPDTSRRALVVSAQRRPHQAFGLSVLSLNGDSTHALTTPPLWTFGDMDPVVSPDGSKIAFVRSIVQGVEDIFVVPTDGGTPTQITTDSTDIDGLTWSEDASEILYAAERSGVSGLWRVQIDGGSPTLIRPASEGTLFSHPTYSAEARRLAYTQKSEQLDIWKLSRPSQYAEFSAELLFSSTQKDIHPTIGPKGNRLAFVSERSGTPEIWVTQSDGSDPNRITALGGAPIRSITWAPQGNRLCFVARHKGHSDLYSISVSGGSPTRLTKAPSEDLVPRWSPEGRWIYFASNRTGQWESWRTRPSADSLHVERVTEGGAVVAQPSPDRSTLYYVRPDTVGIWSVPLDSTNLPLHTKPASQSLPINVIVQFDPEERKSWWVGETGIHFVHRRSNKAVLAYFDFASRRILPLYEFPDWRPVQSLAVGPRGEWFAYTHVVRRESDIMLVEGFR